MNILLTGGAGYVGSACLRDLAKRGHYVVAYDDLRVGCRQSVAGNLLVEGDIADTKLLIETLSAHKVDAVMHFAAATDVTESVERPDYHYENNVCATLSLLRAMHTCDVRRLLFSSTCATYGLSDETDISEKTLQKPVNPYGRSKLAVEWMIRDFADAYGMGFTFLRYFNASGADSDGQYGEAHDPEYHLLPIILQHCLGQRDKVFVYGGDYDTPDGTCVRDYVHTSDLASAHWLAIEAMGLETREAYNIGTGVGVSVLQAIEACGRVTGQKVEYEISDRRPGDPGRLVADGTKLRQMLGWVPTFTDIDAIIDTAWQWHSTHPFGYKKTS